MTAVSRLAEPNVIEALLPLLNLETFELDAAFQLVESLATRAGRTQSPFMAQIDWGGVARRQQDISGTLLTSDEQKNAIGSIVRMSCGLRTALEAMAVIPGSNAQYFALAVLSYLHDLPAAEFLLSIAMSEPALRPLGIGRVLCDARWDLSFNSGELTGHTLTSLRQRLLSLCADDDLSLRQWAANVLANVDAAAGGVFPPDEPRHPHLASGLRWPPPESSSRRAP